MQLVNKGLMMAFSLHGVYPHIYQCGGIWSTPAAIVFNYSHATSLLNLCLKRFILLLELEENSEITPTYVLAEIGQRVRFTCNYDQNVVWFFMTSPEFPQYPPIHHGNMLDFVAAKSHSGFYFCGGHKQGRRYLSRSFVEIIGLKYFTFFTVYKDQLHKINKWFVKPMKKHYINNQYMLNTLPVQAVMQFYEP